ncbi:MAG: radical SAM protein [Desulfurococcales archaeon]|nr:radical SAM protein [Desulfurococcales archaeon]
MLRLGAPDRALLSRPYMAQGCNLCFGGLKAVIFITGLCDDGCFYCPVSREKLGHDVIFVNEEPVYRIDDIILEVARSGASGASITGGDPLTVPHRVFHVIKSLKENFGYGFHIHLYTSGRYATRNVLSRLDQIGLDEIRFHPTHDSFLEKIKLAVSYTSISTGVEIPIAPGLLEWAKKIILYADKVGAEFVNLNELEFVSPNARQLMIRGYRESKKRPFTVEGALEAAIRIVEWARENVSIPVHFCPATFKDKIQTRNRLRNTAVLDRRWCESVTRDGTLLYYSIDANNTCFPVSHECMPGSTLIEAYPTRSRRPIVREEPCQR